MRIIVVLPAPLGPSRPNTSPALASKLTPSTASTWPRRRSRNDFVRFSTWIIHASQEPDDRDIIRRVARPSKAQGVPPVVGSRGREPSGPPVRLGSPDLPNLHLKTASGRAAP